MLDTNNKYWLLPLLPFPFPLPAPFFHGSGVYSHSKEPWENTIRGFYKRCLFLRSLKEPLLIMPKTAVWTLLEHLSEEDSLCALRMWFGIMGRCSLCLLNWSGGAMEVQDSWFYTGFYLQQFKLGFFTVFSVSYQMLFNNNGFIVSLSAAWSIRR